MKPATLKDIRAALDLGATPMADLLGVMPRTYYRYEAGTTKIPLTVERFLITLLKYPNVRNDAIAGVRHEDQNAAPAEAL
jgi:DNA-binding XRE family transcriptional regulator